MPHLSTKLGWLSLVALVLWAPPSAAEEVFADSRDVATLLPQGLVNRNLLAQLSESDQSFRLGRIWEHATLASDLGIGTQQVYLGGGQTRFHAYYLARTYVSVMAFRGLEANLNLLLFNPSASDPYHRVLGISAQATEIAAVLDPEAALKGMSVDTAPSYYKASGGHFTPFISVMNAGYASTWSSGLTLYLDGWSYSTLPTACRRISTNTWSTNSSIYIDEAAAGVSCVTSALASGVADCKSVVLRDLKAPETTPVRTLTISRAARCQAIGNLQMLIVTQWVPRSPDPSDGLQLTAAGQCSGAVAQSESTYVASAEELPAWWPCGSEIPLL